MTVSMLRAIAVTTALLTPFALAAQTAERGLAGNYLAARHATIFNEYEKLAEYSARALAADPTNPALMESTHASLCRVGPH